MSRQQPSGATKGVPRAKIPQGVDDEKFANSLNKINSSLASVSNNTQNKVYGNCPSCNKAVIGSQVEAFGRIYHPEHFQCGNCRCVIYSDNFFELDGNPICDKCNHTAGSVICAECKKPIVGKYTTAKGKSYHPGHFQCFVCKIGLDKIPFMENNGLVYCEKDYNSRFGSCCVECGKPIEGECIQEDGRYWHPDHFKCGFCHKLIESGTYFTVDGKLCCEADYGNQAAAEACGKCGQGISGDFLEAMGRKWHPNHFVCSYCSSSLANADFSEDNGQPYCLECTSKLF